MGLKHWILYNNHFKRHLFFSFFGWGDPFQLRSWSKGWLKLKSSLQKLSDKCQKALAQSLQRPTACKIKNGRQGADHSYQWFRIGLDSCYLLRFVTKIKSTIRLREFGSQYSSNLAVWCYNHTKLSWQMSKTSNPPLGNRSNIQNQYILFQHSLSHLECLI